MQTKHIVAASIVLGLSSLSIMALVTRLFVHKHTAHPTTDQTHISDDSNEHQHQITHISTSWKRMFALTRESTRAHWVPTLSSIIKAGDEGLFSSAMFNKLHAHPGDLSIEAIYEIFAEELRCRPTIERSTYSGHISNFLSSTNRVTSGHRRVQSVSHKTTSKGRADGPPRTLRRSLDLSAAERGLARSMSVKKAAPVLLSMHNGVIEESGEQTVKATWMEEGQILESMSAKIRPAELAALSILLGCPLDVRKEGENVPSKRGAFGISITRTTTEFGEHQVKLQKHKRDVSQLPARGSGFSPLFAKHLAAGSLPFLRNKKDVNSILITSHTFKTVQTGSSLNLYECNFKTPQSKFLTSLPSSRNLGFYVASASTKAQLSNPLIDALSALPFVGGTTPLASIPLIRTVQFVASGGLPPARLLQRLESLVDKVNRNAPHLNIFGPLYEPQNAALAYRERERLGRLATGALATDSLVDKASRMQRYVTLLERLVALVPDMKPQDVLAAVQEATRKELERSYSEAVSARHSNPSRKSSVVDSHGCPKSDARSKRLSSTSYESPYRSPRASTASMRTVSSVNSPRSSNNFPAENLGELVEQILKTELPFSVQTIAHVARMVLVAWTLSVEMVAWEESEDGFNVPDLNKLPENMIMY